MKALGILTSGGDAPGMNAAIYGACVVAHKYGIPCYGYIDGYEGLIDNHFDVLDLSRVKPHVNKGGTFLGTSRSERFKTNHVQEMVSKRLIEDDMGLIVIGGDGSFKGVQALRHHGVRVIGVPATIDNDIEGTELTLGFQTAVRNVVDAVDIIMQSAQSHRHIYAIEVMGRGKGYIAQVAGQALMADGIIAETEDFDINQVLEYIKTSHALDHRYQLFMIAEGAMSAQAFKEAVESHSDYQIHDLVLGHLQRGGNPVAQDRIAGNRVGQKAAQILLDKQEGKKEFIPMNQMNIK